METKFWDFIEKTKGGKSYLESRAQYFSMVEKLAKLSEKSQDALEEVYRAKMDELQTPVFDQAHKQRGGFFKGGDDAFYMDFRAWVVAQGKTLYDDFFSRGVPALKEYIDQYGVSYSDYTFENMVYTFEDATIVRDTPKGDLTEVDIFKITTAAKGKVKAYGLYLQGKNNLLGFRFDFPVNRTVNGVKAHWVFDVPVESVEYTSFPRIFPELAKERIDLIPSGDLLLSQDEIETGVHAITLDNPSLITELGRTLVPSSYRVD